MMNGIDRRLPDKVSPENDRFQYIPDLQRKILYVWVGSKTEVHRLLILAFGVVPETTLVGHPAISLRRTDVSRVHNMFICKQSVRSVLQSNKN